VSAPNSPRKDSTPESLSCSPLIIAQWDRNRREVIRVELGRSNGHDVFSVRTWFRDDGLLKPRSGITLSLRHLPAAAEAVGKALDEARRLGLVE
jgi:hypothetical protein